MILDLELSAHFRAFDWEKVKTFYYVAKIGSFMGTGRFINLTQSAITRQIAELETHLGMPLFTRHKDGVRLTRKGEELLRIIEPTFQELVGFTRKTHVETKQGKKRKIRIVATQAVASYILADLIAKYNQQKPNLSFEVITNDQFIDVMMNDVDVAIRPYDSEIRGVCQEYLFTLEKKLYASPEYLAKYGEPQCVEDLKDHYLIAHARPEYHPYADINWILRLGMPEGELNEPAFTSNSLEVLVKIASKGFGIIGGYEKMEIIKNSNLKNILPSVKGNEIKDYIMYPHYLMQDKEILELKDYLRQNLNN